MRRHLIRFVPVMLVLALVFGCAGTQELTNQDLYYKALGFWTDTYANFKFVFENATPEQQVEMVKSMEYLLEAKESGSQIAVSTA